MSAKIKPIRRVVTGNDAQGRSRVLFESAAPNVNANAFKKGTAMTDIWVYAACPAVISGSRDEGNLPFHFEPPAAGGHLRIVQSDPKPPDYDPARDTYSVPPHPPKQTAGGTWERGGQNPFTTRMHKSETLDFCLVLEGEITLVLDTEEVHLKAGDTVVQRGTNHAWSNRSGRPCRIAFSSHDARG